MLNPKVKRVLCLLVGVTILVAGCVIIPVSKYVIHQTIAKKVPLQKGLMTYEDWVSQPVPIYFELYIFDLLNPMEVVQYGAKPAFAQRGPYTYKEHRQKINITYEHNDTVTYRENRTFVFDRSRSCGHDSDKFTTVNIPMVTIATLIQFEYNWIQELVELALDATADSALFGQYTVRDVVWGYEDPLVKTFKDILSKYNITFDDKFGLFYGNNHTDDGLYNVFVGEEDVSKLAVVNKWEESKYLPYWTSDNSNIINGTDGTRFPPFVKKSDILYVFNTDACRSLYFYYKETITLRGVELYRFVIPNRIFANITENKGFCTPSTHCLPAGLLNVSRCKPESAPIVLSFPNFYGVDPVVQQSVIGLHPTPGVHQTNVDVEPNTGIVMNVDKRFQVNMYIKKVQNIRDTRMINGLVYPILWMNESATIDKTQADIFKSNVQIPIRITEGVQYSLIAIGSLMSLAVFSLILKKYFDDRREPVFVKMN